MFLPCMKTARGLIATLTKVVGDKTEPLKTFEFNPAIPEKFRKHNYFTIRVKYRQAKADKVSRRQIRCQEPISGKFVEGNRFRFPTPFRLRTKQICN